MSSRKTVCGDVKPTVWELNPRQRWLCLTYIQTQCVVSFHRFLKRLQICLYSASYHCWQSRWNLSLRMYHDTLIRCSLLKVSIIFWKTWKKIRECTLNWTCSVVICFYYVLSLYLFYYHMVSRVVTDTCVGKCLKPLPLYNFITPIVMCAHT